MSHVYRFLKWRRGMLCWLLIFSALPLLYTPSVYAEVSVTPQQELDHINGELKQLNDLKNKYKAAATRHQDDGMRWQFMQDYKQEAKRAFQQADLELEMVQQIQVRMDYLEKQKATLLKEHPQLMESGK